MISKRLLGKAHWLVETSIRRENGKWLIHEPLSTGSVAGGRNGP